MRHSAEGEISKDCLCFGNATLSRARATVSEPSAYFLALRGRKLRGVSICDLRRAARHYVQHVPRVEDGKSEAKAQKADELERKRGLVVVREGNRLVTNVVSDVHKCVAKKEEEKSRTSPGLFSTCSERTIWVLPTTGREAMLRSAR